MLRIIAFNLYRILGGIGVGLASAVCPMYIAEIAPSNIRGEEKHNTVFVLTVQILLCSHIMPFHIRHSDVIYQVDVEYLLSGCSGIPVHFE